MKHGSTTPHGSTLIQISQALQCQLCGGAIAYVTTPGGRDALECLSCGKASDLATLGEGAPVCERDDAVAVGLAILRHCDPPEGPAEIDVETDPPNPYPVASRHTSFCRCNGCQSAHAPRCSCGAPGPGLCPACRREATRRLYRPEPVRWTNARPALPITQLDRIIHHWN